MSASDHPRRHREKGSRKYIQSHRVEDDSRILGRANLGSSRNVSVSEYLAGRPLTRRFMQVGGCEDMVRVCEWVDGKKGASTMPALIYC